MHTDQTVTAGGPQAAPPGRTLLQGIRDFVRERLYPPRLQVTFDPGEERFLFPFLYPACRENNHQDAQVLLARFLVTNAGGTPARNVEVFIDSVTVAEDGKTKELLLNLCWASSREEAILDSIAPGVSEYCVLGYFIDRISFMDSNAMGEVVHPVRFALETRLRPNSRIHILEPGSYVVRLKVVADNCPSVTQVVEIRVADRWGDDKEAMIEAGQTVLMHGEER